jgi:hypothetical protein
MLAQVWRGDTRSATTTMANSSVHVQPEEYVGSGRSRVSPAPAVLASHAMMRLLPAAIRLAIVVALSVLAGTSPVHGQILAQVYVTPPKVDNKPVEVQIGFYLDEVPAIDEGANTFDVIGLILLEWSDARLAFDGADGTSRTYLETDATTRLDQIWWPDIQFVNQVRNRERGTWNGSACRCPAGSTCGRFRSTRSG